MQARRLLLSVLRLALVCGLVAADRPAAATKADKKQNKALKRSTSGARPQGSSSTRSAPISARAECR